MTTQSRIIKPEVPTPEHDALSLLLQQHRDIFAAILTEPGWSLKSAALKLEHYHPGPPKLFVDGWLDLKLVADHSDSPLNRETRCWHNGDLTMRLAPTVEPCETCGRMPTIDKSLYCSACTCAHPFVDANLSVRVYPTYKCGRRVTALVEVKPLIVSFGETLRQINLYREHLSPSLTVLLTPDVSFDRAFIQEGVLVVHPTGEPAAPLALSSGRT